ncbi:hypothetical protein V6N13_012934 [Hibiscus sabdariffa]
MISTRPENEAQGRWQPRILKVDHGDVVDSFIANKRDRYGRHFGFVRFSNRMDANRALERLNGFRLYGWRIPVSFAKYKDRTSFWRIKKNTNSGANPTWDVPVRAAQGHTTVPAEVIGKAALGANYEANGDDGCFVGESVE